MNAAGLITVQNSGPLSVATNYGGSEYDRGGKCYCSINAGAVRRLLPKAKRGLVKDFHSAQYLILSRGPWPAADASEAVEITLEDGGADQPFALHFTATSFDMLPGHPEPGREWRLSVWTLENDGPYKAMEFPCKWRRSFQAASRSCRRSKLERMVPRVVEGSLHKFCKPNVSWKRQWHSGNGLLTSPLQTIYLLNDSGSLFWKRDGDWLLVDLTSALRMMIYRIKCTRAHLLRRTNSF